MFGVVKVSSVGEGAGRALNLRSRGGTSWANVSFCAEVALVGRHRRVRAVVLRWAHIQ